MPRLQRMDWDAFRDAHYRPHLVVLDQVPAARHGEGENTVNRLAAALSFTGNYAVKLHGSTIHVAFELAHDEERFARIVGSRWSAAEPEWASRSTARLTRSIQQRIARYLERMGRNALSSIP